MTLRLLPFALALLLALPSQAQWAEDLAPAHLGDEAAEADRAPGAEGIQVHGRWTIIVRDVDETPISEHAFSNALTASGAGVLTHLLNNEYLDDNVPEMIWHLWIDPGSQWSNDSICDPAGSTGCFIGPMTIAEASNYTGDFITSTETTASQLQAFVLTGSIEAYRSGSIHQVRSIVLQYDPGDNEAEGRTFTNKVLDSPVNVAAGQTVEIRVEITFE